MKRKKLGICPFDHFAELRAKRVVVVLGKRGTAPLCWYAVPVNNIEKSQYVDQIRLVLRGDANFLRTAASIFPGKDVRNCLVAFTRFPVAEM